jgi:hypothetical protein
MAAAAYRPGPGPTWDDVHDTIAKLDDFSQRLIFLRQNVHDFDKEVGNLNRMLGVLMVTLDRPSRSALRSVATSFVRSADEFLTFATADPAARTPSQNSQLAEAWGKRWEAVRLNLDNLIDQVAGF